MKHVVCMKWGTVYGPEYVNILHAMLRRNLTGEFKLICFTDDTTGVRSEVECLPLPTLDCEIPPDVPGKWPKIALWGSDFGGLTGNALFIDLDSVIVSNIDCYFTYGHEDDVILARNWVRPFGRHGQTSVFRFPIGKKAFILENLRSDSVRISRKYRFEQNYVTVSMRDSLKFWPYQWTKHFGIHSMGQGPLRLLRAPVQPRGAKIITFPGHPKPPDAIAGRFSANTPILPPWQHLRWAWGQRSTGKRWRKCLWRYVHPTAWVREHWCE